MWSFMPLGGLYWLYGRKEINIGEKKILESYPEFLEKFVDISQNKP